MAEAVASKPGPPPLDPDSVWTKIQQAGVTVPADVIDKLAELDLELSEGENLSLICREVLAYQAFVADS